MGLLEGKTTVTDPIVDVVKSFGSLQALAGVSIEIEQGEFFGLLGPNGAGKTSVLRGMAIGLLGTNDFDVMRRDIRDFIRADCDLASIDLNFSADAGWDFPIPSTPFIIHRHIKLQQ